MEFEDYKQAEFEDLAKRVNCVDNNIDRIRLTMFSPAVSPHSAEYKKLNKELNSYMCEMVKLGGAVYV